MSYVPSAKQISVRGVGVWVDHHDPEAAVRALRKQYIPESVPGGGLIFRTTLVWACEALGGIDVAAIRSPNLKVVIYYGGGGPDHPEGTRLWCMIDSTFTRFETYSHLPRKRDVKALEEVLGPVRNIAV